MGVPYGENERVALYLKKGICMPTGGCDLLNT